MICILTGFRVASCELYSYIFIFFDFISCNSNLSGSDLIKLILINASGDILILQVGQKVVNMMIKSQRQGRDEREAWQEVELEEHLACGCGCEPGAAEACATQSMFNPATCECECTELIWGPERETCLERSGDPGPEGGMLIVANFNSQQLIIKLRLQNVYYRLLLGRENLFVPKQTQG